jgi:hypothetical protein
MKQVHLKFHRRINHSQFPYFPNRRFAGSPPILDNTLLRGTRLNNFGLKLAIAICLLILALFLLAISHCELPCTSG